MHYNITETFTWREEDKQGKKDRWLEVQIIILLNLMTILLLTGNVSTQRKLLYNSLAFPLGSRLPSSPVLHEHLKGHLDMQLFSPPFMVNIQLLCHNSSHLYSAAWPVMSSITIDHYQRKLLSISKQGCWVTVISVY